MNPTARLCLFAGNAAAVGACAARGFVLCAIANTIAVVWFIAVKHFGRSA